MSWSRRQFVLALALAACERGRRPDGPILRVVSLSPSTTEAVFALGVGARLVGRSRYCNHPPEAKSVPAVGGFVDPSLEAILAVKPDLVTGVQGPGLRDFAERLADRGIQTYFPPTQSLGEISEMLRGLGRRLGADEAAGRAVAKLEQEQGEVARAVAGRPRPRALFVFGLRPIVVAGPGSFPDEMLRLSGADNVVRTDRARFPTLGIEQVLALDPDVVVDATGGTMREGMSISKDLPGWSELGALARGRLVVVDDDRVLRPGPRVGEGLVILARALHPGLVIP